MKKPFCVILAILIMLEMTACGKKPETVEVIKSGIVEISSSADETIETPEEQHLLKLASDLTSGFAAVKIECPETRKSSSFQVMVDSEMLSKIAAILIDNKHEIGVQRPRRRDNNSESSSEQSTWRANQEKEQSSLLNEKRFKSQLTTEPINAKIKPPTQSSSVVEPKPKKDPEVYTDGKPPVATSETEKSSSESSIQDVISQDSTDEVQSSSDESKANDNLMEYAKSVTANVNQSSSASSSSATGSEATRSSSSSTSPSSNASSLSTSSESSVASSNGESLILPPIEEPVDDDLIMEAEPDLMAEAEGTLSEPLNSGEYLDITAISEDFYSKMRISLFDKSHYKYPDKAFLELETDDGETNYYLYDKAVYDEIYAVIKESLHGVPVRFSGVNSILRSKYDIDKTRTKFKFTSKEFLQFGGKLIWRFEMENDTSTQFSIIETFDAGTGKSLNSYKMVEPILRIEKSSEQAGYDYRIICAGRMIYKNSANPAQEKIVFLPSSAKLFAGAYDVRGNYTATADKIVYAAEDGVYMSSLDGFERQQLLSGAALSVAMQNVRPELREEGAIASFYFNDPHITPGGKRVAVTIVCPQAKQPLIGVAVTNLDNGKTEYFTDIFKGDEAEVSYPDTATMAARDENGVTFIDLETLSSIYAKFPEKDGARYLTSNFKTYIRSEQRYDENLKCSPLEAYLCSDGNLTDAGNLLLSTQGDTYHQLFATESYIIGYLEDCEGTRYTAMRYATVPNYIAPTSLGLEENTSSNQEYTEELVPPNLSGQDAVAAGLDTSDNSDSEEEKVFAPNYEE